MYGYHMISIQQTSKNSWLVGHILQIPILLPFVSHPFKLCMNFELLNLWVYIIATFLVQKTLGDINEYTIYGEWHFREGIRRLYKLKVQRECVNILMLCTNKGTKFIQLRIFVVQRIHI